MQKAVFLITRLIFLFFRPDFSFQEHIYSSESKPKMLLKRGGGGSFDELQVYSEEMMCLVFCDN